MKKLMIALLATGYCYGMDIQTENSSQLGNSLLTPIGESTSNNLSTSSTPTIIDNTESLVKEWKCWDRLSRILVPVKISLNGINAAFGTAAITTLQQSGSKISQIMSGMSIACSVSSMLLDFYINKMQNRNETINQILNGATSQTTTPVEAL